jgi:hypothetical protein
MRELQKHFPIHLAVQSTFLAVFAIVAILLRMATLLVNPRVNAAKTSRMPFTMECALARALWRTSLVQTGRIRGDKVNFR